MHKKINLKFVLYIFSSELDTKFGYECFFNFSLQRGNDAQRNMAKNYSGTK
jgi:hypothetical protein